MKFGKYLTENQVLQWKDYYIHYKAIKKFISVAELHVDRGISGQDEEYFIGKVEENVRRIEVWFLKVRNACLARFERVQKDLPKEIKSHLPCISEFTSFQQYTTRQLSGTDKSSKSEDKPKKSKSKKSKRKRRSKSEKTKDKSKSRSKKSRDRDTHSITSSSTTGSTTGVKGAKSLTSTRSNPDEQDENVLNIKDRVHVIDMQHNDEQQMPEIQKPKTSQNGDDENENNNDGDEDGNDEYNEADMDDVDTPISSSNDSEDGMSEEEKYNKIYDDVEDSSFNDKYLRRNIDGDVIAPPSTLFIENAVFSHLPPGAHRECVSILLTLGKLKLFAWQNSEGVRKIIKKYDKRFNKTLTSTLWPKIKLNEFVQETKNDSYIAQVAAVLCTRTIPFGHLDANDLRQKGVNLKQMAEAIQMLEQVTHEEDMKEIIPMNVEPRSYMANERTFLKWMRMAALTVLVGMIILSMGHEKVTGVLLIILSIFVLLRSYHEYYKRNEVLVNRIAYDWIDNLGPILLVFSLLLPMITYLIYLMLFGSTTNMFHK